MKRAKALFAGLLVAGQFVACDKAPVTQPLDDATVTLSADSVTVEVDASTSVTATVLHTTETAQFVSRDQSVATVTVSGLITAVGEGKTYVVAALSTRAQARDSVLVRVAAKLPITGIEVPGMASFDQVFSGLLKKYSIPGGAVAVMRDGKLIYARGFGYADVENKRPTQPDALFRIASMSKSITGAAIYRLIEDGKLTLDDPVAPLLADLTPAPGATVDPRWQLITIRNLLTHTGGWDRTLPAGDPMDRGAIAAATLGVPSPVSIETIIRYMKGVPLDFNPGEKQVYSNFGFSILGVVVQRLSGQPYEDFVRSRVLLPVGATRSRSGKSRMSDAFPDEVKYYWPGLGVNEPKVPSIFPGEGMVPYNYGGFYMEAIYASGGWVSSTIDLLRFIGGIDGRADRPDVLKAATIAQMTSVSNGFPTPCSGGGCYYTAGWWIRPMGGDAIWWHGGTLPGSNGMMVRYANFAMVALINTRSLTANLEQALYDALWSGMGGVSSFPDHDLFPNFR